MLLNDEQYIEVIETIKKVFYFLDEEKYDELEAYETDELLGRQMASEKMLKDKHQKLHFDKVRCYSIEDCIKKTINDTQIYVFSLKISFERYITDENNEVVSGTRDYIVDTKYEVSLIKNDEKKEFRCISCDAQLDINDVKCPFCGTLTKIKSNNWIVYDMEEKETYDIINQMRKDSLKQSKDLYDAFKREEEEERRRNRD